MGNTVGKNTRKLSFYLIHEQFDRELIVPQATKPGAR